MPEAPGSQGERVPLSPLTPHSPLLPSCHLSSDFPSSHSQASIQPFISSLGHLLWASEGLDPGDEPVM